MPDANGRFRGLAMSPKANDTWQRIFGQGFKCAPPAPPTFAEVFGMSQARYDAGLPPTRRDDSAKFPRSSDNMGPPSSFKESTP